jgi:hypothetical protein
VAPRPIPPQRLGPNTARPPRTRRLFYRGYDVYDPKNVGFVSDVPSENGRPFFRFDTSVAGNSSAGHEGKAFGTELAADQKDAIVEYLKQF